MSPWHLFVELIRVALFALAHVFGGSVGAAIVALSLAVRLALLPLSLRALFRAREMQERMRTLEPVLARLRARHTGDQQRIAEETMALYRREGISLLPPGTRTSLAVQLPLSAGLYSAVSHLARAGRFLWVADLARPDAALALVAAGLAGLAVVAGPAAPGAASPSRAAALTSGLLTLWFVWRASAALGLYWAVSGATGVAQSLVLRRAVGRGVGETS